MTVFHVTESFGAGVAVAIGQYIQNGPGEKMLLARRRQGEQANVRIQSKSVHYTSTLGETVSQWVKTSRQADFDLVHLHSTLAGVIGRSLPPKRPLIYSPHALAYDGRPRMSIRRLARHLEAILASRTSAAGAVSMHEADLLMSLGMPSSKVVVIPHDVSDLMRLSVGVPDMSHFKVVGVGRIGYQKNPSLFAQIAEKFRGRRDVTFSWIGDGEPLLRAQLEESGVKVSGWLPREAVIQRLQDEHLLLHTARYEGMPLACVEAMALGLPVAAWNIPAYDGIDAITLFDSASEGVRVVQDCRDRVEYDRLRERSWQYSAGLDSQGQADALTDLYGRAAK